MNTYPEFRLSKKALTAAVIIAAFPSFSYAAAAGRVEFAAGAVNAISTDGRERPLSKGSEISAGDTIKTLDGRVQARFTDGGYISLQPDTEFKVEDYNFNGKADGSEKGVFSLIKGGLRAITGSIGHTNRPAYKVNTPVATIGIRGTEFLALYNTRLLVKVGDGAVFLSNLAGNITLYRGQVGEVGGSGVKPRQSSETPSVSAAGPTGASPKVAQEENQQSSINTFVDGNVRLSSENLCQTSSSGCVDLVSVSSFSSSAELDRLNALLMGPLGNIPQLNAAGAFAEYVGTQTVSMFYNTGSITGNATLGVGVDFTDYSVDAVLYVKIAGSPGIDLGQEELIGSISPSVGALNTSTGAISAVTGGTVLLNVDGSGTSLVTGTTGLPTGSGSFSITSGQLQSTNLSQGTVNTSFNIPGESTNNVTYSLQGAVVDAATIPTGP